MNKAFDIEIKIDESVVKTKIANMIIDTLEGHLDELIELVNGDDEVFGLEDRDKLKIMLIRQASRVEW
ncbi:MAG: hypothetical protein GY938_32020 [Ketobacter sp.]|nr:hypothetical protein [Ketobacter sp.]